MGVKKYLRHRKVWGLNGSIQVKCLGQYLECSKYHLSVSCYYFLLAPPPPPVQVRGNEDVGVLEQVLSYGKMALSRNDHRSWAPGMAVGAGEMEVSGATR